MAIPTRSSGIKYCNPIAPEIIGNPAKQQYSRICVSEFWHCSCPHIVVFPTDSCAFFGVLQSRVHQTWALTFAAKLKDDARYIPADCFETFPFPKNFESNGTLEAAGKEYYEFRAALMVRNNEGLTKTYNRFHNPDERDPELLRLRALHAAMDLAVLDAYGWTDLHPTHEFLLDCEEDDDDTEAGTRQRKKPWRYRWPDDFRDEVLARLLDLNNKYAEEEQLTGAAADAAEKKKAQKWPAHWSNYCWTIKPPLKSNSISSIDTV